MRARERARDVVLVAVALCTGVPAVQAAQPPASPLPFERLAAECAPDIHPTTLKGVVTTESAGNPYAIGVVGGRLERQPRNLEEAVATARELERKGFNFSMGLGQVNRHNLSKHGETYETVFEPCRNLRAGGAILKDCYLRAKAQMGDEQQALRAAFSCYYSGNFTRGFRPDQVGQPSYVQKVVANAVDVASGPVVPAVQRQGTDAAVPVLGTPARSGSRSVVTAAKPGSAAAQPSPWVMFAESPRQAPPAAAAAPDGAAVTVRLVTPSAPDAPAAVMAQPAEISARQVREPSLRTSPPSRSERPEAPFVQFVN